MDGIKRSQLRRIHDRGAIDYRVVDPHEGYPIQDTLGLTPHGRRGLDRIEGTQNLDPGERTRYHLGSSLSRATRAAVSGSGSTSFTMAEESRYNASSVTDVRPAAPRARHSTGEKACLSEE